MTGFAEVFYYEPWWIQILKGIVIFAIGLQLVPLVLLIERKLLGRFQARYGPNRVGPFGILQPLADIGKLLGKEQFRPKGAVGALYIAAPAISILTAVAAFAIIPFGNVEDIFGTDVGLYGLDLGIGPLYVFAFGGIAFYGLMLGGWASASKYSFLGAMRAAAQLISYEVSAALALVGVVMTAGTLSLTGIVEAQQGMWYIVPQFVGFLVFTVAGFAETNRAPFDLVEADAELVAGYATEYGGARFASYYFAEYLNVLVVSGIGDDDVPRRLAAALRHPPARLGRPLRGALQDEHLRLPLHLDPGHAPAPALRPAHGLRLEGPAPAGDAQRARHRRPRGGDDAMTPLEPRRRRRRRSSARPPPAPAGGLYRVFGETLRGMKTTFARIVEGPTTIQYPEEKMPVYPRFRGRHRLQPLRGLGPREVRRLLAVRRRLPGRLHPRRGRREHARATACRPASATPRSTRST